MHSESDSSSDDEHVRNLKEAVSEELLCCMNPTDLDGLKSKPASTCHNQGLQNHAEENELKTTPEFRNHVAKKLQHYLDSILQDAVVKVKSKMQNKDIGGVKLLSSSSAYICASDPATDTPVENRRSFRTTNNSPTSSESENESDSWSGVVVSGYDIMRCGEGAFKIQKE